MELVNTKTSILTSKSVKSTLKRTGHQRKWYLWLFCQLSATLTKRNNGLLTSQQTVRTNSMLQMPMIGNGAWWLTLSMSTPMSTYYFPSYVGRKSQWKRKKRQIELHAFTLTPCASFWQCDRGYRPRYHNSHDRIAYFSPKVPCNVRPRLFRHCKSRKSTHCILWHFLTTVLCTAVGMPLPDTLQTHHPSAARSNGRVFHLRCTCAPPSTPALSPPHPHPTIPRRIHFPWTCESNAVHRTHGVLRSLKIVDTNTSL